MPWRNIPPDALQALIQYLGLVIGAIVGSASKITEQIKRGERSQVWGRQLLVDVTSFAIMLLLAAGIAEFFKLGTLATVAVSGILSRAGTEGLDKSIKAGIERIRGQK